MRIINPIEPFPMRTVLLFDIHLVRIGVSSAGDDGLRWIGR
ncbi:MAG: hypothetical protein AVDCRST_MAG83-3485 [uncultured Arthrobacter sp.]|uniref:Uncharacterized protein n=1 Tax=uncultured Arthrobacter sp. TaxID=114050 RepID=A0A6J4JAW1_9MICC|nr:MAG: hypothetical protein AVDCRST_MAG83-3485 [uncultured Arthrobacter sp.]